MSANLPSVSVPAALVQATTVTVVLVVPVQAVGRQASSTSPATGYDVICVPLVK